MSARTVHRPDATLRPVRNDVEGLLTREQVEALLASGVPWQVRWCEGGGLPDESGVGAPGPTHALGRVPSPAQLRKYASGRSRRTLVFARLVTVDGQEIVDLQEGP